MTLIQTNPDRLFDLLPALFRIADDEQAHQLQALLRLIGDEADALHDNTQRLWDDFFIETSQRWVVPYIGELVGNNPLHDLDLSVAARTAESLFTDLASRDLRPLDAIRTRADVAKTIYYRRRKGTIAMLEQLASDVTGWGAHIVEFFSILRWNQHLEHLRPASHGCPDLRRVDVGDRAGGAWDTTSHTVDVRRINEWDGWYNLPNVGFFLWRLSAFPLINVEPRPIGGSSWRFTFSPLGQDLPLFCSGQRDPGESHLASETTLEMPIRAAAFFEDLGNATPTRPPVYYDAGPQGSLAVIRTANGLSIPASDVRCMNLDGWSAFAQPTGTAIGIDVTRGRLVIPTGRAGQAVTVSYSYGFNARMGGGVYDRSKWIVPSTDVPLTGGGTVLDTAIANRPAAQHSVIQVGDDATYDITSDITLAADESLTIQAVDGQRPHLLFPGGSIAVQTSGSGASLTLGGLLIEGGLRVEGDLDMLRVLHSTMVPGCSVEQEATTPPSGPSVAVAAGSQAAPLNRRLQIQIAFSIVGALRIPAQVTKLWILDSIVDGIEKDGDTPTVAIADATNSSGPPAHLERSTVFGSTRFLKLDLASECIFTNAVDVDQQQQGCARFSYIPPGSATPQRYRCQPGLEIALEKERKKAAAALGGPSLPTGWEAAVEAEVEQWLVPSFESDRYGRPDFAQLRRTCPAQIRTGAEDGSEMGAYCVLKQPQREANLRIRLEEYLPVGLEAGLIYVT